MTQLYNFLSKRGQMVSFGLGLIIILLFGFMVWNGLDGFNNLGKEEQGTTTIFNFGLMAAIVLVVLAAILVFLFGILGIFINPGDSKRSLIMLLVIAAIFGVSYMTANVETTGKLAELYSKFSVTPNVAKFIHGGIVTALWLGVISVLSIVLTELGVGSLLGGLFSKK